MPETVLRRFLAGSVAVDAAVREAVVVAAGRVAVREAVVVDVGRVFDVVEVSLPTGLLVEVAVRDVVVEGVVFRSAVEPRTLDLRSAVDAVEAVFRGARVLVVPATDMRLAVPETPRFSSPELATERFSSAELLIDARERWEEVVDVLRGLRVAVVVVVVGRVGGLFSVLVLVREVEVVPGFAAVVDEVGRLVAAVTDTGRLDEAVELGLDLTGGDVGLFSFESSGLVTSSLPESTVDSTGVAGG